MAAGLGLDEPEIVRRYLAGESACSLGKIFGVGYGAILDRLRRNGIEIRDRKTSAAQANSASLDDAEIIRRYLAGETMQAIADSLGVSFIPIMTRLTKAGIARRKDGARLKTVDDAEIVRCYRLGDSELSISLATGVSRPPSAVA